MGTKITSEILKSRGWTRESVRRIYEVWRRGDEGIYFDPVAEKIIVQFPSAHDDLGN